MYILAIFVTHGSTLVVQADYVKWAELLRRYYCSESKLILSTWTWSTVSFCSVIRLAMHSVSTLMESCLAQ